jgi:Tfp pilus assembly protein PilZ
MAENRETATKEKTTEKLEPCQVTFSAGDVVGTGSSSHFHEKGMLILCRNPAPLNEKVKLSLHFPGFKHPMELQAEVVWTNTYGPSDALSPRGMGVKFIGVERDVERLLAELAEQYDSFGSIYSCYYT